MSRIEQRVSEGGRRVSRQQKRGTRLSGRLSTAKSCGEKLLGSRLIPEMVRLHLAPVLIMQASTPTIVE